MNTLNQSHCRVYHPRWQQCSPECHRVPAVTRCWGYHGSVQDWGQVPTTVGLFWSHRTAWGRAGEETVRALSWQGEPLWWWHVKWHTHCTCTHVLVHTRARTHMHTHNTHVTHTAPHTYTLHTHITYYCSLPTVSTLQGILYRTTSTKGIFWDSRGSL